MVGYESKERDLGMLGPFRGEDTSDEPGSWNYDYLFQLEDTLFNQGQQCLTRGDDDLCLQKEASPQGLGHGGDCLRQYDPRPDVRTRQVGPVLSSVGILPDDKEKGHSLDVTDSKRIKCSRLVGWSMWSSQKRKKEKRKVATNSMLIKQLTFAWADLSASCFNKAVEI